tara:strand:+ start:308 stop:520 length:213 start_codon:yes stop_codon:yes gene_type:complete
MNEFCVVCNEETNVPDDRPVSKRRFYVEASGQLCRSCFYDSYHPTPEDIAGRALSDIQTHEVFRNPWSKE